MSETNSYIDAEDLVFNMEGGINSGGFSVKSIMMKNGLSPIMTINDTEELGTDKVSDLFNNLVVPNWVYSNNIKGGKYKEAEIDSDDDVVEDDLHEKLLDLVREHNVKLNKKKYTRRIHKNNTNKRITKRRK